MEVSKTRSCTTSSVVLEPYTQKGLIELNSVRMVVLSLGFARSVVNVRFHVDVKWRGLCKLIPEASHYTDKGSRIQLLKFSWQIYFKP
jgi:hypothetical protein